MRFFILFSSILCLSCTTLDKPFFYQIEKSDHISYLFGTIHAGVIVEDLPEYVTKKIDGAGAIALETEDFDFLANKDSKNAEADQLRIMQRHEGDPRISDLISEQIYQQMLIDFDKETPPGSALARVWLPNINPLSVLGLVSQLPKFGNLVSEIFAFRMNPKFGLDYNIYLRAVKNAQPLKGLDERESKEFKECNFKMAAATITALYTHQKSDTFDSLLETYRTGDEIEVAKIIESQMRHEDIQCLLFDRNQKWLASIEQMHTVFHPVLIAVGVGHLVYGQSSLIHLLEARGFKVTRLKPPP